VALTTHNQLAPKLKKE